MRATLICRSGRLLRRPAPRVGVGRRGSARLHLLGRARPGETAPRVDPRAVAQCAEGRRCGLMRGWLNISSCRRNGRGNAQHLELACAVGHPEAEPAAFGATQPGAADDAGGVSRGVGLGSPHAARQARGEEGAFTHFSSHAPTRTPGPLQARLSLVYPTLDDALEKHPVQLDTVAPLPDCRQDAVALPFGPRMYNPSVSPQDGEARCRPSNMPSYSHSSCCR
jgi:hypothetical protein